MRRMLHLLALGLAAILALGVSAPAALSQERAYAPEDLRVLSRQDQARVIRLEYAEQSGGRSLADDQLEFYLDQINRSSWTFSDVKRDISTSLAESRPPAASVVCASENYRHRECRTGFPGHAALVENISRTRCVENHNWGNRPGAVWVSGGCQGRFVAAGQESDKVVCESRYGRYAECRTGFQGRVHMARQLSSTRCIEDTNWGQRPGVIWVRNSCSAEFAKVPPGSGTDAGDYTVSCISNRGYDRTCTWDTSRGQPVLVRQISGVACERGRTWRYETGRIWVSGGCGALFGVASQAVASTHEVTCTSMRLGTTTWCNWDARKGTPRLKQEYSARRCTEGRTWGHVPARGLWVADGCSARFSPQG